MIYIYRFFYLLLKAFVIVLKPFLGIKMQAWIALRSRNLKALQPLKDSYWFHAASGEIEYVKSLIIHIKKTNPQAQIVVTYSSPSAEKLFNNIKPFVDEFFPLPWDEPRAIKNLIRLINPRLIIFSRTDFWPEFLQQAGDAKIPICIVSFFGELTVIKKWMHRWLFKNVSFISCVEEAQVQQLREILSPETLVTRDGDTRFDQVFWRLEQSSKVQVLNKRPIFICGSTWPEDEAHLLPVFRELTKKYQIIWSPHEVALPNIQRILKVISSQNYSHQLLSEAPSSTLQFTSDILVVDQIGYLADLYRYGEIAFVGGSFKEKVHSVMEPLCCGLPVLLGPYHQNNPEAVRFKDLRDPQIIYVTQCQSDLLRAIAEIETAMKDAPDGLSNQLKEKIKSVMQTQKNSTLKILNTIINTILKNKDF